MHYHLVINHKGKTKKFRQLVCKTGHVLARKAKPARGKIFK